MLSADSSVRERQARSWGPLPATMQRGREGGREAGDTERGQSAQPEQGSLTCFLDRPESLEAPLWLGPL